MLPWTDTHTIGVTGTAQSGKTVFLTSLISHLMHHDPAYFDLGRSNEAAVRYAFVPEAAGDLDVAAVRGSDKFEYRKWRDCLARGAWPDKTTKMYQCRMRLERSPRAWRPLKLRFVDWPGERLADVGIALYAYADWSEYQLARISDDYSLAGEWRTYTRTLDTDGLTLARAIEAYKRLQLGIYRQYRPFICPSSFRLSLDGRELRPTADGVHPDQLCGLPNAEFAPLTAAARQAHPEIAAACERHFQLYKQQVVLPLFHAIAQCDAVIGLVDVLRILMCDVGRYNDTAELLRALLFYCRPPRLTVAGRLLDVVAPKAWRNCAVQRVALLASKADLVPEGEPRDNLGQLLKQLTKTVCPGSPVDVRAFTCSAVQATRPAGDNGRLIGRPRFNVVDGRGCIRPATEPELAFSGSAVPERWPEDWRPGEFTFAEVWPTPLPLRRDATPRQFGVDEAMRFVLSGGGREGSLR